MLIVRDQIIIGIIVFIQDETIIKKNH